MVFRAIKTLEFDGSIENCNACTVHLYNTQSWNHRTIKVGKDL